MLHDDARETLDHSYERTLQTLQKLRRTVTDVATSRKRIELKAQQLQHVQIRRPSASARFRDFANCLATAAIPRHVQTHRTARLRSRSPRLVAWSRFAMHAGVAPVPVSSGRTDRHRLSRGGNRQLNAAVHRIAITQLRLPGPGQDY